MTGFTAEQAERIAAAAARKAELDARAAAVVGQTRQAMRDRGEPVRGDFASRASYRAAVAKYRRKGPKS